MAERTFHLELNEQEINVIWQTLMSGTVTGQNAIHVVTVSQKIQMAVNAANAPQVETKKSEVVEEEKK